MTLTDKYKKIDKEYILSDSSVNEYGFRLLTSGYQLDAFQKNPIGYYMHRREDGVVLKWDNLRIENDVLYGTPVINLSHDRGPQTCDEAENGFLNAASVGHIVVLEYSTDPEQMLPGQTGPTITKWYNKECSLVDIPGNSNALTQLYDAQENELNLPDFQMQHVKGKMQKEFVLTEECLQALNLTEDADNATIAASVKKLSSENKTLLNDIYQLQQQLADLNSNHVKFEVKALLDEALENKKITVALKNKLATDYATNPVSLKSLLDAMPAYRSISEHLKATTRDKAELQWSWDDYERNDPGGKKLKELKANHTERYKEIFKEKFGNQP